MDYFLVAKNQFLKDYNLSEFPKESVFFQEAISFGGQAMNYLNGKPFLNIVYFESLLFISLNLKLYNFVKSYVLKTSPDFFRVFDAPNVFHLNNELEKYGFTIAHLAQYFLPDPKVEFNIDTPFTIQLIENKELESLYLNNHFSMALCGTTQGKRHDVMASICIIDNQIVGVAGCTNDSEEMWQIGVDVLPQYRNKGIGTALVVHLKNNIIKRGKCPFYCCAWSNLASKRLARKAGFVEAWMELASKPVTENWIDEIRKG